MLLCNKTAENMKNEIKPRRIHSTIEYKILCFYGVRGKRAALEVTKEKETHSSLNRIISFSNIVFFYPLTWLFSLRTARLVSVRLKRTNFDEDRI